MAHEELLRIEPGSPAPWPKDWPAAVGVVVRLVNDRVASVLPYHGGETVDDVLRRVSGCIPGQEIPVAPGTPGWPLAEGHGAQQALVEVARMISDDPELLEEALSYALNYDYAASEGKAHLLPARPSPGGTTSSSEPAAEPAAATAGEGFSPLYDMMLLEPVTISQAESAPRHVLVRIPGGAVRTVGYADIHARADGRVVKIALTDDMHPGSLLLPEKVLDHLEGVTVPGPVRAVVQGEFLCISAPTSAPRPTEPAGEAVTPAPRGRWLRSAVNALIAILLVAFFMAAIGTAILSMRGSMGNFPADGFSDGIDNLRGALFPNKES